MQKNTAKRIKQPEKKPNNMKPLAYVAAYNKNNPELFSEIMKNLEELKIKEKKKFETQQETTQKSWKNTHLFYISRKHNTRSYQML